MIDSNLKQILQPPPEYSEAVGQLYKNKSVDIEETLIEKILPGDIITFTYEASNPEKVRRLLVVSTPRGPNGKFYSPKSGSNLLCCFELVENISSLENVFSILYKNEKFSNYKKYSRTLRSFLGPMNFKTFIVNRIKFIQQLVIVNQKD